MVQLFRKRYTSVNEKKYTENYVNGRKIFMKRTQMRDTIKDIKYFTTFINEEQARVKKFLAN